jgi:hypothetical protein
MPMFAVTRKMGARGPAVLNAAVSHSVAVRDAGERPTESDLQQVMGFTAGQSRLAEHGVCELVPSGALAFPPDGNVRPRGTQNVEGEFPQDREILRPVISPVSRAILIETGIENPSCLRRSGFARTGAGGFSIRQCARTAAAKAVASIGTEAR